MRQSHKIIYFFYRLVVYSHIAHSIPWIKSCNRQNQYFIPLQMVDISLLCQSPWSIDVKYNTVVKQNTDFYRFGLISTRKLFFCLVIMAILVIKQNTGGLLLLIWADCCTRTLPIWHFWRTMLEFSQLIVMCYVLPLPLYQWIQSDAVWIPHYTRRD